MILLISPHPQFTRTALRLRPDIPIEIINTFLEDAPTAVETYLAEHTANEVEVIISRDSTASILKKHLSIPVVSADIMGFDLFKAICEAKKYGDDVGYLGYKDDSASYEFSLMANALKIHLHTYFYDDLGGLREQLRLAKEEKIQVVIVASEIAERIAKEFGLNTVLNQTGDYSMRAAFNRTEDIIHAMSVEREMVQDLTSVMNLSNEGLIFADKKWRIAYVNCAAENILKLKRSELVGQPLLESPLKALVSEEMKQGIPVTESLVQLNQQDVVANCLPRLENGQPQGLVINFASVKKLQKTEAYIRRNLFDQGLQSQYSFEDITGSSKRLLEAIQIAKSFGRTEHTIIINGETGSGKERFAHSIHGISKRKDGPFVSINCGALPENLLESEIFGYVDGAFTGAQKGGRIGLVELAHGGTLFLDEIDKMPLSLQSKILRLIQERQVRRIGSNRITSVDVRFIAATNRDLKKQMEGGDFLTDLYYRINVLNIRIPPLRECKDDIELLINCFCQDYLPPISLSIFSKTILDHFLAYDWPGNRRELENLTKRYISFKSCRINENEILLHFPEFQDVLPTDTVLSAQPKEDDGYIHLKPGYYREMERQMFEKLLDKFEGNKTQLANFLGVSRNTITRILKKN